MTENSAIFNARHGAGSFRPPRQAAPWGADLPETRERGKLTSNPEAIWGMSAQLNPTPAVATNGFKLSLTKKITPPNNTAIPRQARPARILLVDI